VAAYCCAPIGIVFQQLDIKTIQATGCANIERAVTYLLDGGDAREGQEEAEMVGKIRVRTGNGFA